jgi:pilus assembly protein CpaC
MPVVAGLCVGLALGAPGEGRAELRVLGAGVHSTLTVPMNRAIVVENDGPFAELSIANPAIADISSLSDRTIYILGKVPGRTTLTILGPEGNLYASVDIHVTPDIEEFKERLGQILPGERIEVRTANDGIVLSGVVSSTAKLDRALDLANRYAPDRVSNLMSVGGTQQVMLKVRFAEMSRSVSKGLGFTTFGTQPGVAAPITSGGRVAAQTFVGNGLADAVGGLALNLGTGALQFNVAIEALESKGLVRTLAEPNLVALSGQEAKFLAGGEYPIPVRAEEGQVTVEYKPFGVELNFTPFVVDGNQINLVINAAVSGIDPTVTVQSGGFTLNAFRRRETSTTVEMRDGESFAIAGLLQDDFRNVGNQVPWLGDIPILGALFRSASYQREQSELVIIVTPHLVSPTRGAALAMPTDRVRPPTERDFFLFGQTARGTRQPGAVGEVARQDFNGAYGYVMD